LRAWFVVLDWEDAIVMTSCLLQGNVHARTHARSILLSRKFIWYRTRLDIGFGFCTWQSNSCNNIEKVSLFVCAKILSLEIIGAASVSIAGIAVQPHAFDHGRRKRRSKIKA
jgi:hypothetical protein